MGEGKEQWNALQQYSKALLTRPHLDFMELELAGSTLNLMGALDMLPIAANQNVIPRIILFVTRMIDLSW